MQENIVIYKSIILNYALVYSLFFRLPRSYLTIQIMIEICTRSLVVQSIYSVYTIYLINIMQIMHCNM